jgi:hypothetical protein
MVHGDPADQGQAVARALEVGVNYFDTAVDFGDARRRKKVACSRTLGVRMPAPILASGRHSHFRRLHIG